VEQTVQSATDSGIDSEQASRQKAARKQYVLPGILISPPQPKSTFFAKLRRWYRWSSLRLSIEELCNSGHRIVRVLEIHKAERLEGKAEVLAWMAGCAVHGPGTRDYILYMQQTGAEYPFLSIFDRLLLSQAWKAGWESCAQKDIVQNQVGIPREAPSTASVPQPQ